MDWLPSQKTANASQKNRTSLQNQPGSSKSDPISGFNSSLLKTKTKSSTSKSSSGKSTGSLLKIGKKAGTSQRNKFDFEDSQDPFGSADPFAFDEEEEELTKWDVLSGKNTSQSQKSSSAFEEDGDQKLDLMVMSQQDSTNVESHDSPQASCSHVNDDEKFDLLADCLLSAVKVLMNLTNDNSVGCQQIAACGGLETLCGLIVNHYPSFSSHLPKFGDHKDKSIIEVDNDNNKRLNDQELDFLVAILGLLVNLVEKDGHNRSFLFLFLSNSKLIDFLFNKVWIIFYLRMELD